MTREGILEKAIKKATANGYKLPSYYKEAIMTTGRYQLNLDIIYSHEFAKALWGHELVDKYGLTWKEHQQRMKDGWHYPIHYKWNGTEISWGFHLKNMVVCEDIIKYLEESMSL